jgi:hypothetical protein
LHFSINQAFMTPNANHFFRKVTAMTLNELSAIDTAYKFLQPLDVTARRRALQWLTDALSQNPAPVAVVTATPVTADTEPAAAAVEQSPKRRSAAAAASTPPTPNAKKVKSAARNGAGAKQSGKKAAATGHERAYRRMPEPATVMKAYKRIGSVSGLAEHFDVPAHTVTHWARRLRAEGYQIGRQS